ncbi:MAG: hypothetical protein GKR97_07550 [Rhizobiaceae bacterium]|nr:hypothetical protein [Rhizobiaceae bacterium]
MFKYLIARNLFRTLLIVSAGLLAAPYSASAQEGLGTLNDLLPESPGSTVNRSLNGRIRLFKNVLIHPMPVWSSFENGPAPAERTKMKTSNNKGLYKMTMVPGDEQLADWRNLFTVVAHEKSNPSVIRHGLTVVGQFKALCSPSNMQAFKVHATPQRLIQVVACGNYSRDRATGQIAAIVTLRNKSGLVTMTRHWRTSSFQSKVVTAWPIPKTEIDNVLAELSRSKLVPIKN